jgi:hypothetical protein
LTAVALLSLFAVSLVNSRPARAATLPALSVSDTTGQVLAGGSPITLHGANVSVTESACAQNFTDDTFAGEPLTSASTWSAMAAWHINVVRIPLNEDCWLNINGVRVGGAAYQQAIQNEVSAAHAAGIYVILDLHWTAPGTWRARSQQPGPDEDHSVTFWQQVSTAYKGDTGAIFDLYNEPFDYWGVSTDQWGDWLNGGTQTQYMTGGTDNNGNPVGYTVTANWQTAGMQQLVTTIRNTGAGNPILINGLGWANDDSGWLAHVPSDPAKALIVGEHIYPGQPCSDSTCWDQQTSAVKTAGYPVLVGETGEATDCAADQAAGNPTVECNWYANSNFLNYADQHGWSYLAWTWNTWTDPHFVLIKDWSGTPTTGEGTDYRNHLLGLPGGGGGGGDTVTVTQPAAQTSTVGTAVSLQIQASDSASGQTLTYSATGLPQGVAINSGSGLISGTPTTAGSSSVTVTATDTTGASGSATFAWTVNATTGGGGSLAALSVSDTGGQILAGGNPIKLHGANASGTETGCTQTGADPYGGAPLGDQATFSAMAAWHVNVVRIPLNEDCWLNINGVTVGGAAYQQAIQKEVTAAHAAGLYAILDLDYSAPGTTLALQQNPLPDADHSGPFWQQVATAYAGDKDTIFDLFNAPFDWWSTGTDTWADWQNGGTQTQVITGGNPWQVSQTWQTIGMQQLVWTVRNTGATNPIIVNGLNKANDDSGWLSHAPSDPAKALIVGTHQYPTDTCTGQTCWNGVFPAIKTAGYPVLVGETGDAADCSRDSAQCNWLTNTLFPYADSQGWSYLGAWWNPWGQADDNLITDYQGTPTTGEGTEVRNHFLTLS